MRMRQEEGQSANGSERELADISEWVGTHQQALRLYCRSLAGSPWEGDDLAQDTWLKVWSAWRGGVDGERMTRAYLYRAARNAWIDRNRKKRVSLVREPLEDELQIAEVNALDVWTAMETLVQTLVPAQRTALLLVDILKYTAAEAAELIDSTEGAVKAALHRARAKLKTSMTENTTEHPYPNRHRTVEGERSLGNEKSESDELMAYAYLEAFRQQNTAAMVMLMNDSASKEVVISLLQVQRQSERLQNSSLSPKNGNPSMQLAA